MTKKERAQLVQKILNEYFPHPKIPLKHTDPFTLLISVLLSAQCTDERVNQVTPKLFAKGPNPEKMAILPLKEIEEIIRPCGLFRTRAKHIQALSKILNDKYKGDVPTTLRALEALPGVGHKTASVVLIQAFHTPAFPVDTHIHRCARRWGLSSGKSVKQTETDLKKLFPKESWEKLHLQIILFARTHCPASSHNKESCPLCSKLERIERTA